MTITRLSFAAFAACLSSSGCSSLTKVDAPDALQPQQLDTPSGAGVLRAGAIKLFYYEDVLNFYAVPGASGLLSDELVTGNDAQAQTIDQRRTDPANGDIPFFALAETRLNLLRAIGVSKSLPEIPRAYSGEMYALVGYVELFYGELFCSGVPLSNIVNGNVQYGTPLTTQQIFARALTDFDSATVYAADTARFLDLALVGKARVLLDLGQYAAAAAAVQPVPTSFVFNAEAAAATGQGNLIGINIAGGFLYGVADKQGGNGLDFVSSHDPRVQVDSLGFANDGVTPIYTYVPYVSFNAPIPFSSGVEARLIEAEADLQAGDVTDWLATLNALRAGGGGVSGLAPLADPGTPDARVDLMFRERAFWLFFTGHRLGDLRRLIRQYGRSADAVFPAGQYKTLGTFGADVNLPVPTSEEINPNFHGCLDRNA